MKELQQSSTSYPIQFLLVASSDHVTPVTGITPTVTIRKNGGSFGSPAGAVTEIANGWYELAGNATDRNTLGSLLLHATGTGADPCDDRYYIVPWDPFDANMGLSRLDVAVSTRNSTTPPTVTAIRTEMDSNSTKLANLDAAISTRSTYAGGAVASVTAGVTVTTNNDKSGYSLSVTPPTAVQIRTEMDSNSTKLANLDATISSRSTYAGGAVASVTAGVTVSTNNDKSGYSLSVTPPTAVQIRTEMDSNSTKLAHLDADISTRSTYSGGAVASVTSPVTVGTNSDKTGYTLVVTPPTAVQIRTEMDSNSTKLANLDAAVSTRSTFAGGAVASVTAPVTVGTNSDKSGYSLAVTPPTAVQIRTEMDDNSTKLAHLDADVSSVGGSTITVEEIRIEMDDNSTKLANLDATISSRSTYSGADTSGTTTLLGRLTSARAGYLDTLNGLVSAIWAAVDKTGYSLTSAYDPAKTAMQAGDQVDLVDSPNALAITAIQSGLALQSLLTTVASYIDTEVAAIKAKTDGLPSDPADASDIAAAFGSISSFLGGMADDITSHFNDTLAALPPAPDNNSIAAILTRTNLIPDNPTDVSDLPTIPTTDQIADKVLIRNLAGSADGGRTVQDALRSLRNKVRIQNGTIHVYTEDDTTEAWSAAVSTDPHADPIVTMDPE